MFARSLRVAVEMSACSVAFETMIEPSYCIICLLEQCTKL